MTEANSNTGLDWAHLGLDELLAQLRTAGSKPEPELLDAIRALGGEAVPALISMVTNPAEYEYAPGDEEGVTGWAPYSAVQILGEIHPPEALEPLLSLFSWDDYDYLSEELPDVIAKFGEPALDPLTAILAEPPNTVWTRWRAARGLKELATAHPGLRDEIVRRFTSQLDTDEPDDEDWPILVGALVSVLVDLKAEESLPSIIRAFEHDFIDPYMIDWEDVSRELDLPPGVAPHLEGKGRGRQSLFDSLLQPPMPRPAPARSARGATGVGRTGPIPYRRETPKVGRNDPCPCGSGKKYKKCHGR
jgi:HEAT repeat protein